MGKRNKKKKFNEFSANESFDSHFRRDGRNYDTNRFGKAKFYNYDRYSYNQFKHKRDRNFPSKKPKRQPSRPQSPVLGTPEYMEKKIEQTSAIIMRQLLNPDESPPLNVIPQNKNDENVTDNNSPHQELTKSVESPSISNKNKKKLSSQEVEEIHTKIMCHLSNLNKGRKRNLINSNNSGYDTTIQHFVKQQRLEISRALRTMCSTVQIEKDIEESNEIINSIIPDIGIKIEELPKDVIEELSNTFGCDFNVDFNMDSFGNYLINEVPQFDQIQENSNNIFIKQEVDASHNFATTLEDTQKQLEKEIQLINRVNSSEIMAEDDDVVVIDNSEDIIEINDDEDIKENEDVKKVTILDQVIPSSSTTNSMECGEDIKSPFEMVGSVFPETNINQDLPRTDKREGFDEVDQKEDFDKLEKADSEGTLKLEFEATDSVVLKKEIGDEKVNIDVYKNDKNGDIVQDVIIEKVKPLTNSKDEECLVPMKDSDAVPLEPIVKKINCSINCSTQTKLQEEPVTIDLLLEKNFKNKPTNLSQAVGRMMIIDQWVARLTSYRQDMLKELASHGNENSAILESEKASGHSKMVKKRRIVNDEIDFSDNEDFAKEILEDCIEEITFDDIDNSSTYDTLMHINKVDDVIAVITIFEDKLVAGSESGKIYICSLNDGKFLQILPLHTPVPITSLVLVKEGICSTNMYIGTFRDHLLVYNFESYHYLRSITVEESVQCMDTKWGYIFIGCIEGWLQRYCIERETMEYDEKFNDGTILSLKATVEGPRRILLVASEESPVYIRDAMTGLHLRTIAKYDTYNVHSMIVERNLIYCGTSKGELFMLSFHKGTMLQTAKIPGASGKVCMKFYRNILFISRDKDVNLYDVKTNKFIGEIKGPGGAILCLEIARNQLILGTNARNFVAIPIDWSLFKNR